MLQTEVRLKVVKTHLWYHFQAFAPFYIFFLRNWLVQMVNTIGAEKLPVLNFSHHSPKPTDFLNIIIHTIILLLMTFSHRFVFYWFVSLCSWYASHVGYPWRLVCTCLLAQLRKGESNIQYSRPSDREMEAISENFFPVSNYCPSDTLNGSS